MATEAGKIKLRPYQKECVKILNELPEGSKSVCAIATGLGKTVIMSRIKCKGKMLILSHRDELVRQPEKYFAEQGLSFGVEKGSEMADLKCKVVSASVQTLKSDSRLKRYSPEHFEIIIVDEAHHSAAPTYRKIINYFHPKKLIGMTATPQRGDGIGLEDIYNDIVYKKDILWGIKNGYLTNLNCRMIVVKNITLNGIRMTAGDFNASELSDRIDVEEMFSQITETYQNYCLDKHTLIYTLSVKGCYEVQKHLRRLFNTKKEKNSIQVITGKIPLEERQRIEKDFLTGKVRCIINCMTLTEGTDLPNADAIICARPTVNPTLYTQIIGRGTRLYPGKESCLVLDIAPRSKRNLCNMYTLVGTNTNEENKETDLLEIAKKAEKQEEDIINQYESAERDYDLFEGALRDLYKKTKEAIENDTLNEELGNTARYGDEELEKLLDKHNLYYTVGITAATKIVIKAGQEDTFLLSEPDMLNRTNVIALLDGTHYRTEKPVKVPKVVETIALWLSKYRNGSDSTFYWNAKQVRSWQASEATEKQINYICKLAMDLRFAPEKVNVNNKYEATLAINRFKTLQKDIESLKSRKSDVLVKQENFEKLMESRERREQEALSLAGKKRGQDTGEAQLTVIDDGIDWHSFKEIEASVKDARALENSIEDDGVTKLQFSISVSPPHFYEFSASSKQISYAVMLAKKLAEKQAEMDIDIEQFVKNRNRMSTVSSTIEILMYLTGSDVAGLFVTPKYIKLRNLLIDISKETAGSTNENQRAVTVEIVKK